MSNSNQIVKNILSMGTAELSAKGLAVIYTLYLISTIGPESNGALSFAKSIVQYFFIIVMLGFDQAGIRDVARNQALLPKYVGSILMLRIALAILGYIGIIITTHIIDSFSPIADVTKRMIYIYGFLLFGQATLLTWVYMAVEKMHILAIRSLVLGILNLVGIMVFVKSESDVEIAIIIITISFMVNSIWMFIHYKSTFGKLSFSFDKSFILSLFRQSFSIGLIFLIATMYNNIDITMLGIIKDERETGIFAAAHQLLAFLILPTLILQGAFFPKFSRATNFEERDKVISIFSRINFLLGSFIALNLFLYSDLIVVLLGTQYAESSGALKILSVTIFLQYIVVNYFQPLISWKYEDKVIKATLIGLTLNVIVNMILIPIYGLYGAAIATIFSELSVLTMMLILFRKVHGNLYLPNLAKAFVATLIGVSPGFVMLALGLNMYLSVIVTVTACILIYLYTKLVDFNEIRGYLKK
ncbi:MAG: flippase [Candidatus Kapabacteria bacterium]|nr:flippase [Candidatus Kapabacteria bacterium]